MNSKIIKIISVLLSVFIIVYVIIQIITFFYSPYEAQTVFRATVNNSIRTQALAVRDETVISQNKDGVLSYRVTDGGKVAQSSVIADKYATEEDMQSQKRAAELGEEIAVLTEAQKEGSTAAATLDSLTSQINENYLELMSMLGNQDYTELTQYRLDLQELFCKKQIVIGKAENFNERISELQQQQKQLQSSISAQPTSVTSPDSGYFSQTVDGWETRFSCDDMAKLTSDQLADVLESVKTTPVTRDETKIGKVIQSFEWKIAVLVDASEAPSLSKGTTVDLVFPSYGSDTYRATVSRAEFDKNNEKNIVIFDCDIMDSTVSKLRIDDVEIILSTVTGIQVPKEAVRYNADNEMGVYEKIGQKLYFRKIDKLYETDQYVISKIHDEEDTEHEYVHVYDDVVIKGKDLYDEKPIE